MQNSAQFLLQDWFNITRRGLVISGQIVSGQIAAGDFICLNDELIKIESIEIGDKSSYEFFVGLILETNDESGIISALKKLKGKNLLVLTAGLSN